MKAFGHQVPSREGVRVKSRKTYPCERKILVAKTQNFHGSAKNSHLFYEMRHKRIYIAVKQAAETHCLWVKARYCVFNDFYGSETASSSSSRLPLVRLQARQHLTKGCRDFGDNCCNFIGQNHKKTQVHARSESIVCKSVRTRP